MIKRYDPVYCEMSENADGDYVKFSDIEHLIKNEELEYALIVHQLESEDIDPKLNQKLLDSAKLFPRNKPHDWDVKIEPI